MFSRFISKLMIACLLGLFSTNVFSQTVSSPVVGFLSQTINPQTDTILNVGFQQSPVAAGKLIESPQDLGSLQLIKLHGSVQIDTDSLADTHYVHVTSGLDSGRIYPVSSNHSNEITIVAGGDGFELEQDDKVEVIPWWTLETLLPSAEQPDGQKAEGFLPPDRRLEVFMYSNTEGTNFSPSRVFFLSNTGWKESLRGFSDAGNVIVPPASVLIVRSRGSETWKLVTSGTVSMASNSYILSTKSDSSQDNVIGLTRPVPVLISELGLGNESVFRSSSSTDQGDRLDELLVIDNTSSVQNRRPSAIYFKVAGGWRQDVAGFPVSDDVSISAESGIVIRKAPTASGDPVVWVNHPNYP